MGDKPFFSIITVVRNGENLIGRCLNSVLQQKFQDFEFLLIDGQSTDGTLDVIARYDDDRIKLTSEADKGIYDAMNKAVAIARGQWVYFLGHDDYLFDDSVLQDIFDEVTSKPLDLIYGVVKWGDTDSTFGKEVTLEDLKHSFICHQALFVRKELFAQVGHFDLKYRFNADAHFIIRCFHLSQLKKQFIPRIIAYYATDGASSLNVDASFVRDKYSFFEKLSFLEKIKRTYFMLKPSWFKPSRIFKRKVKALKSPPKHTT